MANNSTEPRYIGQNTRFMPANLCVCVRVYVHYVRQSEMQCRGCPFLTLALAMIRPYDVPSLKKKREINDCWSVDGQILIKDTANKVIPIHNEADLKKNASRLINP